MAGQSKIKWTTHCDEAWRRVVKCYKFGGSEFLDYCSLLFGGVSIFGGGVFILGFVFVVFWNCLFRFWFLGFLAFWLPRPLPFKFYRTLS